MSMRRALSNHGRGGVKNTTVAIPVPLHRKFRKHCRQRRERLTAAVIRLIRRELEAARTAEA